MKQILRKGLKDIIVDEVPDPVVSPHHILVRPIYSLISSGTETASIHQESAARFAESCSAAIRKERLCRKAHGADAARMPRPVSSRRRFRKTAHRRIQPALRANLSEREEANCKTNRTRGVELPRQFAGNLRILLDGGSRDRRRNPRRSVPLCRFDALAARF